MMNSDRNQNRKTFFFQDRISEPPKNAKYRAFHWQKKWGGWFVALRANIKCLYTSGALISFFNAPWIYIYTCHVPPGGYDVRCK
jgi:hypothetical protein